MNKHKYGIQSTCLLNQAVRTTTNEAIKGKLTKHCRVMENDYTILTGHL